MQKLVNAWYMTLDYINAHPQESLDIMANEGGAVGRPTTPTWPRARSSSRSTTRSQRSRTAPPPTSLQYMARQVNPFMVKSGLTKKQASLKGLFVPKFTQAYADSTSTP